MAGQADYLPVVHHQAMSDADESGSVVGGPSGEARAAPMAVLLPLVDRVLEGVRIGLSSNDSQLLWRPSTYGRIFSLAALSHQCLYIEQVKNGLVADVPSCVLALMVRHHLETWFTGMYLLLGGDRALQAFLGNTQKASDKQRQHVERLREKGRLHDFEFHELDKDFDWEPSDFNYFEVARNLDDIGLSDGLLGGVEETYALAYRSLSGQLGGHPTHYMLDKYIDTAAGLFVRVDERPKDQPFRRAALQWCVVLTTAHAERAFSERGIDSSWLVPVRQTLSDHWPTAGGGGLALA